MLTIRIPDDSPIQRVLLTDLPNGWNQYPHLTATKEIGKFWIEQQKALILQVPSAVYSDETNWLINPQHPHAKLIEVISVKPFVFSDRLFR